MPTLNGIPTIKLLLKGAKDEIRYIEFIIDGKTRLLSTKRFLDMFKNGKELINDFNGKKLTD